MAEPILQLTEEEFEQIEEAIARTQKGRAFLRRYQRRAMGASLEEVRSMLTDFRLAWEHHQQTLQAANHVEVLRRELIEMASSIDQARREVASLRPPDKDDDRLTVAASELDAIVISTERASNDILNAAERLMEFVGKIRVGGADADLCNEMDMLITSIFTACSFQDLTGQRTSKVVNALRYIEQRINAMINIWGDGHLAPHPIIPDIADPREDAHLLHGPAREGEGVSQADVDTMFSQSPAAAPTSQSQADVDAMFATPAPANRAKASQDDIDAMFAAPANPAKANQDDIDAMFAAPAKPTKANQDDIDAMFAAPAKPTKANQDDIDAMFETAVKSKQAGTSASQKPKAKPKPAEPALPQKTELDQSAIDALFG